METNPHGLVFITQVFVGIAATLVVYKALEYDWVAGWATGIVLTVSVIGVEWRLGEALFTGSYEQIQMLTAVAIAGGVVGVITTVVLTKPDIDTAPRQYEKSNNDQMEG